MSMNLTEEQKYQIESLLQLRVIEKVGQGSETPIYDMLQEADTIIDDFLNSGGGE